MKDQTYCGFVAIIGKSNVGKSTLLNKLMGKELSITADRSQTTRNNILGIKTIGNRQAIYIDTPGITLKNITKLNKLMNKAAKSSYKDADLILFVVESLSWDQDDQQVLKLLAKLNNPPKVFLLLSKTDLLKDHNVLLPKVTALMEQYNFTEVFPISVAKNSNIQALKTAIFNNLPLAPHYFFDKDLTDRDLNFRIAEKIREKLIKNLSQELPYSTHVQVFKLERHPKLYKIYANIWVEKIGQKKIVIGKEGQQLKLIGTQARLALEKLLNKQVFLNLFVQVKANWTNNEANLKNLNI